MTDHFIKNIEINNFKCFDSFKAEGFARVNLIGGKNNVGKTAFMEACHINTSAIDLNKFTTSLFDIKYMRENLNILNGKKDNDLVFAYVELSSGLSIKTNINISSFEIDEKEEGTKKYQFQFADKGPITIIPKAYSFEYDHPANNLFIDSFGFSNAEIIALYSSVQKKDKEDFLNKLLNKFDSSITSFKIIQETPQCKVMDKYLPITELGDGVRHLVSIVVCLFASENGYLFIDEVENGIHYTMLDDIWRLIISLSKELNVQVFATTHSKECIESYARVAKKLKDEDISYTILTKLKDGSIDAGVYNSKMLINTLEQDHEVRGW